MTNYNAWLKQAVGKFKQPFDWLERIERGEQVPEAIIMPQRT